MHPSDEEFVHDVAQLACYCSSVMISELTIYESTGAFVWEMLELEKKAAIFGNNGKYIVSTCKGNRGSGFNCWFTYLLSKEVVINSVSSPPYIGAHNNQGR